MGKREKTGIETKLAAAALAVSILSMLSSGTFTYLNWRDTQQRFEQRENEIVDVDINPTLPGGNALHVYLRDSETLYADRFKFLFRDNLLALVMPVEIRLYNLNKEQPATIRDSFLIPRGDRLSEEDPGESESVSKYGFYGVVKEGRADSFTIEPGGAHIIKAEAKMDPSSELKIFLCDFIEEHFDSYQIDPANDVATADGTYNPEVDKMIYDGILAFYDPYCPQWDNYTGAWYKANGERKEVHMSQPERGYSWDYYATTSTGNRFPASVDFYERNHRWYGAY